MASTSTEPAHTHLCGQRFGSRTVLAVEPQKRRGAVFVRVRCDCGAEDCVGLPLLQAGRSNSCRTCATRQRHRQVGHMLLETAVDRRLQRRVNSMIQRCTNPNDRSWRNYGGRGIKFCFASLREAVEYIKTELPHSDYLGLDIDRQRNSGHYAPGNLRLVSRRTNLRNTRRSVLSDADYVWARDCSPYTELTTLKMLRWGLTRKKIIALAQEAVVSRRKGWVRIASRLAAATTSSTADPAPGSAPTGG